MPRSAQEIRESILPAILPAAGPEAIFLSVVTGGRSFPGALEKDLPEALEVPLRSLHSCVQQSLFWVTDFFNKYVYILGNLTELFK